MPKGILNSTIHTGKVKPEGYVRFEILGLVEISSFSKELKEHYSSHVLPLLKKLHPDGPVISFAFLSEPPAIEIRKMVS